MDDEYGSVMPIASMHDAMVLAVYMPPQLPWPGQAWRTMSLRSSSLILPSIISPYAWKDEMMSRLRPPQWPAAMVPPYTISAGRSTLHMAIRQPGMFLSQPGTVTTASYHCACMTVSMLSAMMSRDGSE